MVGQRSKRAAKSRVPHECVFQPMLRRTLRCASRASSSFSLAAVSMGFALPKGFDFGRGAVAGKLRGSRSTDAVRSAGAA